MRLEPQEIRAIREAARAVFGARTTVRVFGSRTHDHLKGGDLDLYLEAEPGQATLANEMTFRDLIERPLDDLKADVVLHGGGAPLAPIDEIELGDGVQLGARRQQPHHGCHIDAWYKTSILLLAEPPSPSWSEPP